MTVRSLRGESPAVSRNAINPDSSSPCNDGTTNTERSRLSSVAISDRANGSANSVGGGNVSSCGNGNNSNMNNNRRWDDGKYYNWRTYFPHDGGLFACLRWLRSGYGGEKAKETDEVIRENLHHLATMLTLLREYHSLYGMPDEGGHKDQEYVLREVLTNLYTGGVPIWTLESAMERGAEGLTGREGVEFCIFPRTAFIFAPSSGATCMFRIAREFDIHKLTSTERILVRLASFASNTHGVVSLPSRLPHPNELKEAEQRSASNNAGLEALIQQAATSSSETNREAMATKILNLACESQGLFYFINSAAHSPSRSPDFEQTRVNGGIDEFDEVRQFWKVDNKTSELFSRLATLEAIQMIAELKVNVEAKQYSILMALLFRFVASAGACIVWFHGGWIDSLVAGVCGAMVGLISIWRALSKEESMIFEAFASLMVGIIAGVVSLLLPTKTCFGAIGVAGIIDILQGFRVVCAVLELMSKHSVSGSADFLEGLFYTGLIAYCLKVGQLVAVYATNAPTTAEYVTCNDSVDEMWKLCLVPAAALSWSGIFNPDGEDLPWMAFHGVLAYIVTWACSQGSVPDNVALFLAALCVTFSSGLVSRFTGRQAMGNTVAGLYVIVPGAFLVESLFLDLSFNFMGPVVLNAAIIGTGAWAGTILCSPTILGTTTALLKKRSRTGERALQRDFSVRSHGQGAMLFF